MPAAPHDAVPTRPDDEAPAGSGGPVDVEAYLQKVLAEIDADVEARRAAGELPAGLEQQLDELFLEFAPVGARGSDRLRETVALVDGAAYVDISVPTDSNRPGGAFVKRLIRKTVRWYFHFVVHQITRFAWAVSRALHAMVDRLEELEERVEALQPPPSPPLTADQPSPAGTWWAPEVVRALGSSGGRVLHGDCGNASLVEQLVASGVDAYGVDPHGALLEDAIDRGTDVRSEPLLGHLRAVASGALGGVVLSGSIQWCGHPDRRHIAEEVARALAPGGLVAVASSEPGSWATSAPPVLADLAPGRPYHAETWEHVFGARFERVSLASESGGYLLVLRRA